VKSAAQLSQWLRRSKQRLGSHGTQATDEFGLNDLQLPFEKFATIRDLVGRRSPIAGWSALQGVQNVDLLAPQRAGFNDLIQQLPRRAHEGLTLAILIGSGRFAHEAQTRFRVSNAEHRLGAGRCQLGTLSACSDFLAKLSQCLNSAFWRRLIQNIRRLSSFRYIRTV